MTVDDLTIWQAQERHRARARLLADGTPPHLVESLLQVAEDMHDDQAQCAARMTGEAPAVAIH